MLNVANLSKPSDKQESQTISCLYNLLLNNDYIRWNGTEIKIRPPQGLTTINKINFRSFTGDLLPYTSLDLPELNITLKAVVSDTFDESAYSIYLIGNDNVEGIDAYHEIKNEQKNKDTSSNIITTFNKAWTYDSAESSQIEYNISELVNYLNESLLSWFGPITTKYFLGYTQNFNQIPYTKFFALKPFDNCVGRLFFNNNRVARIPYLSGNAINYNTFDLSSYSAFSYPYFASSDDNQKFVYYELGYNSTASMHGQVIFYNGTEISVNEKIDRTYSSIWANAKVKCVPHAYINMSSDKNLLLILPYRMDGVMSNLIIYNNDEKNTITLPDTHANFVEYNLIGICINNMYQLNIVLLCIDTNGQAWIDFAAIGVATYDYTSLRTLVKLSEEDKQELINSDVWHLSCGLTWNFNRNVANIGGLIYYSFYRSIYNDSTKKIRILYYKPDSNDSNYIFANSDKLSKDKSICRSYYPASRLTLAQNINYAFNKGYYPAISTDTKITDNTYFINEIPASDGISSYYFDGNIINYSYKYIFNNFQCYYMNNGTAQYPINSIDNHITYNDILFKYENGVLSFPSIVWSNTSFVTFVPIITTNPKYFNIRFDIPQTTTMGEYSITQNDVNIDFHGLNQHVYSTLETLLLLKYEYNDLMLRVNNFPNTDNFVFSINETCNVDFKKMNSSSNNMELNVNLCDSSGNAIDYSTIKKLYGKVVLAIDWEQT